MSGTDRLRAIAGAWDEWGLGGSLTEIADEIERERAEDCYRMGLDCGTVWRVVADMERHCLGHEGMEDSPVARWARELRDALDGAVTGEDREAAEWVRKRGGLDHVRAEWNERVPRDLYQRKRWRLLGHIAECETALGRRREIISNLGHRVSDLTRENAELRKRAMPEGCEWPRYEDGEPVRFGDAVSGVVVRSIVFSENGIRILLSDYTSVPRWGSWKSYGELIKRPAVLAGDGEPLEVGQTVWDTNGDELVIGALEDGGNTVTCRYADVGDSIPVHGMWSPSDLTHQRPVLDADGVPIKKGDTVYVAPFDDPLTVRGFAADGRVLMDYHSDDSFGYSSENLTHAKPEPPDTWERIEEDAKLWPGEYAQGHPGWAEHDGRLSEFMALDLVLRAKKLAGVDND